MAATSFYRRGGALLWRAVRTHPRPFSVSIVGAVAFALAAVGQTVVLGRVTDRLIIPAFDGASPDGGTGATTGLVVGAVVAIVAVALVKSVGVVLRRYFAAVTSSRMQVTWRAGIADRYLRVPLGYHRSRPTGQLLAHADADVHLAAEVINPLPFSVAVIVLMTVAAVTLALVDVYLLAVALVLFPLLGVVNHYYSSRVAGFAAEAQHRIGEVSAIAHESYDGVLTVKTLGRERDEVARLDGAAGALRDARLGVGRLRAVFEPSLDALPGLGIVGVLAVGGWRISTGAVTPGDVVQAMALFQILAFPVRVVGFLLEEMPRSVVAADRVERVLAEPDEPSVDGTASLPAGPLDLTAVAVEHARDGPPVLRGVDLTVGPGEVVALVGSTGSGKSTLLELLSRLERPDRGRILLGGVPIEELSSAERTEAVGLVFQESFLFADSVRENLTVGADVDDARLAGALAVARAEFVHELPDGLDTVLGERGVTLSGGQRQRVALARALLRRPRVLLLDDATSAVDPRVEADILDRLRRDVRATTLVVAHRLSTISLADRVLFLDDGRIAATGSHAELAASVPAYRALVRAYEQALA